MPDLTVLTYLIRDFNLIKAFDLIRVVDSSGKMYLPLPILYSVGTFS